MSDEQGRKIHVGLNRVKKIGETTGQHLHELLNSKVDHHDYMCDHSAWDCKWYSCELSRVKLLFDI
jgi:hydroxypyruvate isomerase